MTAAAPGRPARGTPGPGLAARPGWPARAPGRRRGAGARIQGARPPPAGRTAPRHLPAESLLDHLPQNRPGELRNLERLSALSPEVPAKILPLPKPHFGFQLFESNRRINRREELDRAAVRPSAKRTLITRADLPHKRYVAADLAPLDLCSQLQAHTRQLTYLLGG